MKCSKQGVWKTATDLPIPEPKMKTEQTPWGAIQEPMSDREKFLAKVDEGTARGRKQVGMKPRTDPWETRKQKMMEIKRKAFK